MDAVALLTGRRGSLIRWLTLLTLAAVISTFGDRVVPRVQAQSPVGANFVLDAGDLRFILRQIQIAQTHSAATLAANPCATLLAQIGEFRLPFGLRTVDGQCNHLEDATTGVDKTKFGAADQTFPRLTGQRDLANNLQGIFRDGDNGTSYEQTTGIVVDSQPRIISNLIADQTTSNQAAALVAAAGFGGLPDPADPNVCPPGSSPRCLETFFFGNVAPDVGLSAPFNAMFTFFGQFFDHGLDLVNKGGSGMVIVPLPPDDPLIVGGDGIAGTEDDPPSPPPPDLRFMALTRGTNLPGPDGIAGDNPATPQDESADDIHQGTNQTSPFVDQNQTYTSHPSHQVFLRQYRLVANRPVSTGRMIDGADAAGISNGHIGNWGEIKRQAATMLGIQLTDQDVFNVPMLVTDLYGYFRRGPVRQLPQIVVRTAAGLSSVQGFLQDDPATPQVEGPILIPANAVRTGHAFLDDIAHSANPFGDNDTDPTNAPGPRVPDADTVAGIDDGINATYDDELLNLHFVTGDGRGNENIALTAVHTIFHSEHNRLAGQIPGLIQTFFANGQMTLQERNGWLNPDPVSGWDFGERLFQASKFVTEMQYQHLVFEEFARKLVPSINEFIGDGINFLSSTNPAILAEFAHQTYRLGHSMLTETISRTRGDGSTYDIPLLQGFLNPLEFTRNPDTATGEPRLNAAQAAGAVWRGGVRQVGNDIDEFITEAVRNNLLGLPLDLPVLNLARGRDQGIPPLNEVRRQLFLETSDFAMLPYDSWSGFEFDMKHPESLINFIAAYGLHDTLVGADRRRGTADDPALTMAQRRERARALADPTVAGPADRSDFLFSTGTWATPSGTPTSTGVDDIDLWIGGLAERISPFGGMLGTTLSYVFEHQLENLQNADRFYYLERLDGLNLLSQLEGNSFTELIQRNTVIGGDAGAEVFARPDAVINLAFQPLPPAPLVDDPLSPDFDEAVELTRLPNGTIRYAGPAHVIWNGRDDAISDRVISSEGDDTLRGNGGNDVMEGGAGNDNHIGGDGDDILTDTFGEDVMKGGPGNDAISGGSGPFDLLQGNQGNDFIVGGNDASEVFGGPGNDIIYMGDGLSESMGGDGNDWMEGTVSPASILIGDENNQFQDDPFEGHDVLIAGKGDADFDSEGGDDIMVATVTPTHRLEGMLGFDWGTYRGDPLPVDADLRLRVVLPPNLDELRDRFDLTEALSGWNQNDRLSGDDRGGTAVGDPEASMLGHELTAANINALWVNPPDAPGGVATNTLATFLTAFGITPPFAAGNIILGGLGSDIIEGRGGDDLIDGDAWLNVQLRAPSPGAPAGNFKRVETLQLLRADVFAGRINPGSISIVRTIVGGTGNAPGTDIAVFSGVRANYTISAPSPTGVITVTDNVGLDGSDRLRNIERLRFADQEVVLGNNNPATGVPILSQPLPQENEALSVSTAGVADLDGIQAGSFTFQWQAAPVGTASFVDIPNATLSTFTPLQAQVGQVLRVMVTFLDIPGRRETVWSGASGVVGDVFVGTGVVDAFSGTAGRDNAEGNAGNDNLNMGDSNDVASGSGGNDTLTMGNGNDTATGGPGNDRINGNAGDDILNGDAGVDNISGGPGIDTILGGNDADTINGGDGADIIDGQAGTDTINGGTGNDTISGGNENDILRGDAGSDNINGNVGDDDINGGAGNDTMDGGGGFNTFRFTAGFGNDTVNRFLANPDPLVNRQDLLNVSALGITAANFVSRVSIAASGVNTVVTARNATGGIIGTITLTSTPVANVTIADFSFTP